MHSSLRANLMAEFQNRQILNIALVVGLVTPTLGIVGHHCPVDQQSSAFLISWHTYIYWPKIGMILIHSHQMTIVVLAVFFLFFSFFFGGGRGQCPWLNSQVQHALKLLWHTSIPPAGLQLEIAAVDYTGTVMEKGRVGMASLCFPHLIMQLFSGEAFMLLLSVQCMAWQGWVSCGTEPYRFISTGLVDSTTAPAPAPPSSYSPGPRIPASNHYHIFHTLVNSEFTRNILQPPVFSRWWLLRSWRDFGCFRVNHREVQASIVLSMY